MEALHNPHRTVLKFAEGDFVMLATDFNLTEVDRQRPKAKLLPRYTGPYKVLCVKDFDTYTLELPPAMSRQHPDFHVSLLKAFTENPADFKTRTPAPPPPTVEPETQALLYEVEELLDVRITRSQVEYLVKWKGFDLSAASWTAECDVGLPIIEAFHSKMKTSRDSVPRRSTRANVGPSGIGR